MKMLVRSLFLLFIICISITTLWTKLYAQETMKISFGPINATAGDVVDLKVSIANVPKEGVKSLKFQISGSGSGYLLLCGYTQGDVGILPEDIKAYGDNSTVIEFLATGDNLLKNDGVLINLKYKILEVPRGAGTGYSSFDVSGCMYDNITYGMVYKLVGKKVGEALDGNGENEDYTLEFITGGKISPNYKASDQLYSVSDSSPRFVLESTEGKPGEIVTVEIKVNDIIARRGISDGWFIFSYDTNRLSFLESNPGVLGDKVTVRSYTGEVRVDIKNYFNTFKYPFDKDDAIVKLKFRISDECYAEELMFKQSNAGIAYDYDIGFMGRSALDIRKLKINGPPKYTLGVRAEEVGGKPGDTVKVGVKFENVLTEGVEFGVIDVVYDADKFIYQGIEAGAIVFDAASDISIKNTANGLRILYLNNGKGCIKESGLLCTLKFKIAPNCPNGSYKIGVESTSNFYNKYNEKMPAPNFYDGTVTVVASEKGGVYYGDYNRDGIIDTADFTNLRRILLGKSSVPAEDNTYIKRMDVNLDGEVDTGDYTMIRRKLLGILNNFPAGIEF